MTLQVCTEEDAYVQRLGFASQNLLRLRRKTRFARLSPPADSRTFCARNSRFALVAYFSQTVLNRFFCFAKPLAPPAKDSLRSSFASGGLSYLLRSKLALCARGLFLTDGVKPILWQRLYSAMHDWASNTILIDASSCLIAHLCGLLVMHGVKINLVCHVIYPTQYLYSDSELDHSHHGDFWQNT